MLETPSARRQDCAIDEYDHERAPSHDIDPRSLTDDELERELTIAVDSSEPHRLAYYEMLLREKAERRVRKGEPEE